MILKHNNKYYVTMSEIETGTCTGCAFTTVDTPSPECYARHELLFLGKKSTCSSLTVIFKRYSMNQLMKEL